MMAKKTSVKKKVLVLLAICVPLLIVLLVSSADKQRTKIDYVAEYNRISKPANFDPNENAAPYLRKPFEIITKEPNDIKPFDKLWPADMNEDQLRITKQWVESNRQTFDYIKQALTKPYYWRPLHSDNNDLMNAETNDLWLFREATYLLCIDAKFIAIQGQTEPAMRQLVDVYKMGTFLAGPKSMIEQLVGMAISALSVQSAFQILDHTNPSPSILEDFQKQISSFASQQSFIADFTVERLMFYDWIERICVGKDQPKLSEHPGLIFKKIFFGTVGRTWAASEKRKADIVYGYLNYSAHKTPWQLHSEGNDVDSVLEKMVKGTIYLRNFVPADSRVLLISYRVQVQTDALIATIAILRYKADVGKYPKDLQELVASDYLDKLPMDPFSGGMLTYKLSGDNFELYSFAEDLDDDSGKHDPEWADEGDGDYVFWPVQKIETISRTKQQN
jgi:hypothetical protein